MLEGNNLDTLFVLRDTKTRRVSSYDREGGNNDSALIQPQGTLDVADIGGSGVIRHIWCTLSSTDPDILSRAVLRMYWDGEQNPSVEAPIGDFFGIGMGLTRNFVSEPLSMCPQDGRAFNCYFPMPFASGARITLENESDVQMNFFYYIDYELMDVRDDFGRFHAQWRRERDTDGFARREGKDLGERSPLAGTSRSDTWPALWDAPNLDGKGNYVILEAEGRGHYVGCNLNIFNFEKQINDWYGEGDDMIFIDGDVLPTLNGTGTEDYFNTAYCPRTPYNAPWHGLTVYSGDELGRPWQGANSMYRFHVKDPIRFQQSIRVTIEHGHANKLSNDYSSTAYWYQEEPHNAGYRMPQAEERIPRKNDQSE